MGTVHLRVPLRTQGTQRSRIAGLCLSRQFKLLGLPRIPEEDVSFVQR